MSCSCLWGERGKNVQTKYKKISGFPHQKTQVPCLWASLSIVRVIAPCLVTASLEYSHPVALLNSLVAHCYHPNPFYSKAANKRLSLCIICSTNELQSRHYTNRSHWWRTRRMSWSHVQLKKKEQFKVNRHQWSWIALSWGKSWSDHMFNHPLKNMIYDMVLIFILFVYS